MGGRRAAGNSGNLAPWPSSATGVLCGFRHVIHLFGLQVLQGKIKKLGSGV